MTNETDIKKIAHQHGQIEQFFSGGFAVKGKPPSPAVKVDAKAIADKQARLDAIADEVNKCCKCGLSKTRTHAVPGEENPDARIAFVGEAPGADEDAQGRPFVGRAGKLLDKIINAMGLQRKDVFICNILKCRPPRKPRPQAG
jgi:DNA polymerase